MQHVHPFITSKDLRAIYAAEIINARRNHAERLSTAWCADQRDYERARFHGVLFGLCRAFIVMQTARNSGKRNRMVKEIMRGANHQRTVQL